MGVYHRGPLLPRAALSDARALDESPSPRGYSGQQQSQSQSQSNDSANASPLVNNTNSIHRKKEVIGPKTGEIQRLMFNKLYREFVQVETVRGR